MRAVSDIDWIQQCTIGARLVAGLGCGGNAEVRAAPPGASARRGTSSL